LKVKLNDSRFVFGKPKKKNIISIYPTTNNKHNTTNNKQQTATTNDANPQTYPTYVNYSTTVDIDLFYCLFFSSFLFLLLFSSFSN